MSARSLSKRCGVFRFVGVTSSEPWPGSVIATRQWNTPRAVFVAGCDIELSRVISSFGLNAVTTVCIDNAVS